LILFFTVGKCLFCFFIASFLYRARIKEIRLICPSSLLKTTNLEFFGDQEQASNTIIQRDHRRARPQNIVGVIQHDVVQRSVDIEIKKRTHNASKLKLSQLSKQIKKKNKASQKQIVSETKIQNVKKYRSTSKRACTSEEKCSFNLRIFLSQDNNWYLSIPQSNNCVIHKFHLRVGKEHQKTRLKDISKEINKFILELPLELSTSNVSQIIHKKFKKNLTVDQIRLMREKKLDDELAIFLEDPLMSSSAERLLAFFKTLNDVSYIYMLDDVNTGLVTHRVKRGDNEPTRSPIAVEDRDFVTMVESWRLDLSVKRKKVPPTILVSIAWSHDYEVNEFRLYGQYIAVDVTFGLNRNDRSLLVTCGCDSSMRTTTFFRALMPSKQRSAFSWCLEKGATFCLGDGYTRIVSCVASDQEKSLLDAIALHPVLKNSMHRYDCFHILVFPWIKSITTRSHDKPESTILENLYQWIFSWFYYTESKIEFETSYSLFKDYYSQHSHDIQSYKSDIDDILHAIVSNIDNCSLYSFLHTACFDFLGDSIVESYNSVLRKKIKSNSSLTAMVSKMFLMTKEKAHRCQM